MNKKIIVSIIVILAIIAGIAIHYFEENKENAPESKIGNDILIGFSMSTLQEERWQRDRDEFLNKAEELGAVVDLQAAGNDKARQISQIESMIIKGVNVLVIAPYDAESLTEIIDKAHQAGIKVISYDRLIRNADVDLYLSFDNVKVGQYEAQSVIDALKDKLGKGQKLKVAYIGGAQTDNNASLLKTGSFTVLQPYIDNGQIEIALDKFTVDWNPENAYKNLKEYLDRTDGAIDAVIAANDGTAFGSIRALEEYDLDGKVPVSGQDAELSAIQRVVLGTQTATVYKPIPKLASAGVELAIKLAKGEDIVENNKVNNGKIDVPSVLLESVLVTKDNISETVIKDGYYTSEEIYKK